LRLYARDLVSLRLSKLLGYAAKGVEPELIQHMTEEERELYVRLRSLIKAWLQSLGLEV
jgi:DNA replication initiation complex subunit (GINS family)